MKAAVIGALVFAGLMAAVGTAPDMCQVFAQRPVTNDFKANGELIVLSTAVGDNRQQITVIEPKTRVMSVYQVDGATGEIALRSVRNIHWDLQMTDFNGTDPLPLAVRSLTEQH